MIPRSKLNEGGKVMNQMLRSHSKGGVVLRLFGGALSIWAGASLLGLLITHFLAPSRMSFLDRGADTWLASHRSTRLNTLTSWASSLSNTRTMILLTLIFIIFLRLKLKRWHESIFLLTVMGGELVIFLAIALTVNRARPAVLKLDAAPPTSSFPSGHTSAAMALFGALAVLLLSEWGSLFWRRIFATLLFAIPVVVALARVYRGMHYPSDVLAGALSAGLWLLIARKTLFSGQATLPALKITRSKK